MAPPGPSMGSPDTSLSVTFALCPETTCSLIWGGKGADPSRPHALPSLQSQESPDPPAMPSTTAFYRLGRSTHRVPQSTPDRILTLVRLIQKAKVPQRTRPGLSCCPQRPRPAPHSAFSSPFLEAGAVLCTAGHGGPTLPSGLISNTAPSSLRLAVPS